MIYQKVGGSQSGASNKYGAKKTEYNGRIFDSKKEAEYAGELDLLRKAAGESDRVVDVEYQIPFVLEVNETKIGKYILDFKVTYADGRIEHVDVKGLRKGCAYQMFRWKAKHMKAQYDIDVIEV